MPSLRTTIVVPCYNEAERLDTQAFADYVAAHDRVSFLFVDDGSSDDTWSVVSALAATHDRLTAMQLADNGGKAEAVRRGILLAAKTAEVVGFWDADLATPLATIGNFIDILEERPKIEIVIGARVKLLGRRIERKTLRHYFGRGAAMLVSNMLQLPVYDTQCGAKLFVVNDRLPALFEQPFSTKWTFDVEVLARWIGAMGRMERDELEEFIVEYPLLSWTDVAGSKLQPTDFMRTPIDLATIWRRYRHLL